MRRLLVCTLILMGAAQLGAAEPQPLTPAALLVGTAGQWQGELQYRDYQSNQWQGLPMKVAIVAQPDGVTLVRTASYDDWPQTGIVYITTVSQLDPAGADLCAVPQRPSRR
jgi:hypothetical protein